MKKTFTRTNVNLEKLQEMNADLEGNLNEILKGDCTDDEIKDFCCFAVAEARGLKRDNTTVFWAYAEPQTMPADARDEFVYLPTYLMAQILIAAALRLPEMMEDKHFAATLEYGLNGCCGRKLEGHGIDNTAVIQNAKSFLKSGYAEFALKYPKISPRFKKIMQKIAKYNQLEIPGWFLGDYRCGEKERLYIAYGSNMNRNQMAERCPGAELVGIGILPRAKLEFYLYATVEKANGKDANVPVAVWRITEEHEKDLDFYEGVAGHYYKKEKANVILNDGCRVEGLIYLMENYRCFPVGESYYEGIAEAYRELGLSAEIDKVLKPAKVRSLKR